MPTRFETTEIEFDADTGVGHLRLDRPEAMNALNSKLRSEIITGLQDLESRSEDGQRTGLRVVVLEGAAENFCAGADINEFSKLSKAKVSGQDHFRFIREFPVPVIAKIRGYCLGGGLETALSCDFRIAEEGASLGFPEVDLGIIPGAGGVPLMSTVASPAAALSLAMTGTRINADRALNLGIVNQVHNERFDAAVEEFAQTIASKPPLAIQAIKRSVRVTTEGGAEAGIRYDRQQFESLNSTEDHAEGVRGFRNQDHEPVFEGQ